MSFKDNPSVGGHTRNSACSVLIVENSAAQETIFLQEMRLVLCACTVSIDC